MKSVTMTDATPTELPLPLPLSLSLPHSGHSRYLEVQEQGDLVRDDLRDVGGEPRVLQGPTRALQDLPLQLNAQIGEALVLVLFAF